MQDSGSSLELQCVVFYNVKLRKSFDKQWGSLQDMQIGKTFNYSMKAYLQQHLNIYDLGIPRYFLGIEFVYQDKKLVVTYQEYALDMLQETKLLGCKLETSSMGARP